MCGRFILTASATEIATILECKTNLCTKPRYNIAPSQAILAARINDCGEKELTFLKWGLLPFFVKDKKKSPTPINAKAETAYKLPYFRNAFKNRRCLIPVSGFYEWHKENNTKQPYLIHLKNTQVFFFAGLYEEWVSDDGEVIESATILTTQATNAVSKIHHRMPVILPKSHYEDWLDKENKDIDVLKSLLRKNDCDNVDIYPVSTIVNSPKNDTAKCIEPLA